MSENERRFDVRRVWQGALLIWGRHIVVFAALAGVAYFILKLLNGVQQAAGWFLPEASAWATAGALLALVVAWVAGQGLVALLILGHYRRFSRGEGLAFGTCYAEACGAWGRYVVNVLMLLALAVFGLSLSIVLLEAGRMLYVADQANLLPLIGTHLAAVIFIIAMGWYGFYFSFAPLIGAYEGKRPLAAFRESRRRIRGHALGYMVTLGLFGLGYLSVGLALYFGLTALGAGREALSWIDPVMLVVFSPLWLALWYASYDHLTRLKSEASGAGS